MDEYINRKDAIAKIREEGIYGSGYSDSEREENVIDMIECVPAADVWPVVKAEWYGEGDGYADGELVYDMWSCPICGKRFEEWEEKPDWNFCPNCGADMRGKS
jgi:rubrerythrin